MNIQKQLDDYHRYHQNKINLAIHIIGIPMIVFSLIIASSWPSICFQPYFKVPLSVPLIIALTAFYACYNRNVALISLIGFVPMAAIGIIMSHKFLKIALLTALTLFILGWILQLIGHWIEKKKPAFSDNILHLLIGPLFIVIELQNIFSKKNKF